MARSHDSGRGVLDEQAALRSIVEGTATETGTGFFRSLVENLQRTLGTLGAWVATFDEDTRNLRALSMKMRDEWLDGLTYNLPGSPCETAIEERRVLHIPDRIIELYRNQPALAHYGAVSYMGVPLFAADGRVIGQLAVLDDKPMPSEPRGMAIFQIFANRAAAELSRLEAERAMAEREAQLRLLFESAMDAIVDFDDDFRVALMNPAARRLFACELETRPTSDVRELLHADSRTQLSRCMQELMDPGSTRSCLWIAGGLCGLTCQNESFQAEATLSHYRLGTSHRLTLILRNVEERVAAERTITALTRQTEYLREELKALEDYEGIVGSSPALLRALHEVEQVAATETTVLLSGETGTGKELFARAVHARSRRANKPLVKLNCGAIPHTLIESELFGHEKGAFTGATQRRDGRFVLADAGTLFLDEIGELPLELQPKLLRVLQEGEFEPVGSSRTISVDVRIVAATNRDLLECVKRGTFREDLYYRLAVFPIRIPALREREHDVEQLALAFVDRYARKLGRPISKLPEASLRRLLAYAWPGNVRELQNVIERGVILAKDGVFDIQRALPEGAAHSPARASPKPSPQDQVYTVDELLELERTNIERALQRAGGKVAGPTGAAALMGTHPSTLNSRMRSLGVKRRA